MPRDRLRGRHVRLELRNVVANHPFERSHRFAEIQPNSSYQDHSRLSCGLGRCSSGLMPGSRQATEGLWATEAATAAARRIASMPTHGYEATPEAARPRSPRAARVISITLSRASICRAKSCRANRCRRMVHALLKRGPDLLRAAAHIRRQAGNAGCP